MRLFISVAAFALCIAACGTDGNTPKSGNMAQNLPDSVAIAQTIHGFYKWYNSHSEALDTALAYRVADGSGPMWRLDEKGLTGFLAAFAQSGFVSQEFIENERFFYKKCAQDWGSTPVEDIPTGMDADKYVCGQDGDFSEFESARVVVTPNALNPTRAMAEMLFAPNSANGKKRRFEVVKEQGKWLITSIECDMGIDASRPVH